MEKVKWSLCPRHIVYKGVDVHMHCFVTEDLYIYASDRIRVPAVLPPRNTLVLSEYETGWNPEPVWAFWKQNDLFPQTRNNIQMHIKSTKGEGVVWHHVP